MSIKTLVIYLFTASFILAQENNFNLSFDDLSKMLEHSSPQLEIINSKQDILKTQRRAALQWSNPELNYGYETVGDNSVEETEEIFYFNKNLRLPGAYLLEKKMWDSKVSAGESRSIHYRSQLLSTLKAEYVKLKLLMNLSDSQSRLKKMLEDLNETVLARQEEGEIAPLEAILLSMSLFKLDSEIIHDQQETINSMSLIKQLLDIDHFVQLTPSTHIKFYKVQHSDIEKLVLNEEHPGINANDMILMASSKNIKLEKRKFLSSISLHGGYKDLNSNLSGYVLGLSFPIPLLNQNKAQIERQKLHHRIQLEENAIYKKQLESNFENLINKVIVNAEWLEKSSNEIYNLSLIEDFLIAYQEGAISLSELLNTIQLYQDNNKQYLNQMITYYKSIFELEAHSGYQLIEF